ncbi:MAG: MerR family transcriptional regulator [Candidatus Omnitrophota bacterium]
MTKLVVEGRLYNAIETAKLLGISKQTLFRYEKKGILPRARRNLINRWRQYTEDEILKLREIIRGSIA